LDLLGYSTKYEHGINQTTQTTLNNTTQKKPPTIRPFSSMYNNNETLACSNGQLCDTLSMSRTDV